MQVPHKDQAAEDARRAAAAQEEPDVQDQKKPARSWQNDKKVEETKETE